MTVLFLLMGTAHPPTGTNNPFNRFFAGWHFSEAGAAGQYRIKRKNLALGGVKRLFGKLERGVTIW
jgi:hypothetical protein